MLTATRKERNRFNICEIKIIRTQLGLCERKDVQITSVT